MHRSKTKWGFDADSENSGHSWGYGRSQRLVQVFER